MMTDFNEMAHLLRECKVDKFDKQQDKQWCPVDNPWHEERQVLSEIERLNLFARMHDGED
jgi:hypothetical protein